MEIKRALLNKVQAESPDRLDHQQANTSGLPIPRDRRRNIMTGWRIHWSAGNSQPAGALQRLLEILETPDTDPPIWQRFETLLRPAPGQAKSMLKTRQTSSRTA